MEVLHRARFGLRAFLLGVILGAFAVYFVAPLFAETNTIRPDGDGTSVAGTPDTCTSSLRWECLNDDVTEPDSPPTDADILEMSNNDINFSTLGTFNDIDTATSATIWVYHRDGGTNSFLRVGLYAANESTSYGSTDFGNQTTSGWSSTTFTGLSLTQAQVDGMRLRLECDKVGGGSSNNCFIYAAYVDVNFNPQIETTVGAIGSQQNLTIGSTFAHIGGAFTITENVNERSVTDITITESGSVDANDDLENVALWYDLDTTGGDGYNCSDQSFNGNELQYGATSTNGFSGDDGTITFSDTVTASTSQTLCLYTVLDIATTSAAGQTIEVSIADPPTDVSVTGTDIDIEPDATVALSGTTVIQAQDRDQIHYHWRNDDGDQGDGAGGATSATGGTQDTTLDALGINQPIRVRIGVSNEGNRTSDATAYRLEYAQKETTCGVVETWTDVNATDDDINMYDSANLTNGNDTTDIAVASGGVSDENLTYLGTNGGVRDTSSQTGALTLTSSEYVDLEYSIIASTTATAGNTYCFRVSNAGDSLETYSVYPEATILADVTVASVESLNSTVDIPTTNVEAGAFFSISDNIAGTTTLQGITLTASGTVDTSSDIADVALWYDLDTTGGDSYNCSDQSYNGNEQQFGATSTNGFTADQIAFTSSQELNTTQSMCIYLIYSASSTITDGEQIDFRISNASNDVSIDSGTIAPNALVDLAGVTTFVDDIATQVHYHWRNDDGSESGATAATTSEDALLENLRRTSPIRLRIGVANEGSSSTPAYQYRLEYALKQTTCSAASGWEDVDATDDAFNMFDSPNLVDGNDTANINVSQGGVSDVGETYLTNNNAVKDTSSQVAALALPGKNFVDLEYAITASTTATEGATYCFRVTDAGDDTVLGYDVYPEVSIKPKTDFFVQRGVTTISGDSGTITAGTQYIAPQSSSTAFIRILGTHNLAGGSTGGVGSPEQVTAYVSDPWNIENSITFQRTAGAPDTTRVAWEIIEYVGAPGGNNEMVVRQQGWAPYDSASTTVTTSPATSAVSTTSIAVFVTGQGNPDTGVNYPYGLSTASFNEGASTTQFTRGASGNTATTSYAVVEFVGDNWDVQRAEHTYTSTGVETESISPVGSITQAFIHTQKRLGSGLNTHSNLGHTVYLSGVGQLTFDLEAGATSPGSHVSVAWVIENTQTVGDAMLVTRSNGSESAGTGPKTVNVDHDAPLSDSADASLFINNYGNETGGGGDQNSFPEPILSAELISTTQYQLWIAQPSNDTRTWRAEVVDWPTAARDIEQNYYRFYVDNDALDPTDPWPAGATDIGENTEVTVNDSPIALGENMRLRMTLQISSAAMEPDIDAFKLQYGERETTCTAIGEDEWSDVGDIGSTTALWRGTTTAQTDGAALSVDPPDPGDLNISLSDVAGTFEEENPSAFTPFVVDPGEDVEFDWVVQHNAAKEKTSYCFRMIESDGDLLDAWNFYPTMRTAGYTPTLSQWRFYDDESSPTPGTALAPEQTAPTDIAFDNIIKLRTTINESTGGEGTDIKFKLQYSTEADFSSNVHDVAASSTCAAQATSTANLWCYDDGAGDDNGVIDAAVLSDADTCSGGVGAGCGTYNEGTSTVSATYDQPAYSTAEYEFTLRQDGARANTVYYFRLFDLTNATSVPASTTYPSLQVEGPQLTFTIDGIASGTVSEGVTSDVDTTVSSVPFGSVPLDTEYHAIYRLNIDTGATEGYRALMFARSELLNTYGESIAPVTGTNASPVGWSTGCAPTALSCFGYHTGDDILEGGSVRFAADDTYAALSTSDPEEIAHSPAPTTESIDIVYKLQVSDQQPAGDYETEIVYLVIPTF